MVDQDADRADEEQPDDGGEGDQDTHRRQRDVQDLPQVDNQERQHQADSERVDGDAHEHQPGVAVHGTRVTAGADRSHPSYAPTRRG